MTHHSSHSGPESWHWMRFRFRSPASYFGQQESYGLKHPRWVPQHKSVERRERVDTPHSPLALDLLHGHFRGLLPLPLFEPFPRDTLQRPREAPVPLALQIAELHRAQLSRQLEDLGLLPGEEGRERRGQRGMEGTGLVGD